MLPFLSLCHVPCYLLYAFSFNFLKKFLWLMTQYKAKMKAEYERKSWNTFRTMTKYTVTEDVIGLDMRVWCPSQDQNSGDIHVSIVGIQFDFFKCLHMSLTFCCVLECNWKFTTYYFSFEGINTNFSHVNFGQDLLTKRYVWILDIKINRGVLLGNHYWKKVLQETIYTYIYFPNYILVFFAPFFGV